MKRPAFQFYPKDWRSDVKLRSCSLAARGLWVELMCLMHDCEPYGHLAIEGHQVSRETAANLLGVTPAVYHKLLAELEAAGVPSRTPEGILFSRRMVRDEEIRQLRATVGSRGGQAKALANGLAKPLAKLQQEGRQTVADATADADSGGSQGGVGGREARVRALVPPDAHAALDGLLRGAHNPAALLGEIEMLPERIRGVTWEHIGTALRDLSLGGGKVTGLALRTFVQRAMREAEPGGPPGAAPRDDDYTAAAAIARREREAAGA